VNFLSTILAREFNIIPDKGVIPGEKLTESELSYLKKINAYHDDETIFYFFSPGYLSLEDDGNYFTDEKVVSYRQEYEPKGFYLMSARYDQIKDITINYKSDMFKPTEIIITKHDGSQFLLVVSNFGYMGRTFADGLMTQWEANR